VTHCTYVCFLLIKPLSYCCKIKEKGWPDRLHQEYISYLQPNILNT
jgi:hypothetical protein